MGDIFYEVNLVTEEQEHITTLSFTKDQLDKIIQYAIIRALKDQIALSEQNTEQNTEQTTE